MPVTIINAETILPVFDTHIKVSAGPGAGKTKWLVNHILNVLNKSDHLGVTRKIACIAYTNVAVDTITKRLNDGIHQVEVTTIHSFLYQHVLKPYAHFLPASYEVNAALIKGHDDKILTGYTFINDWKTRTGQARIRDIKAVAKAFRKMEWTFNTTGQLVVGTSYPFAADGYNIKTASYLEYKKMAWAQGVIHHDDVLFLAYELIRLFPFILDILRAKFPYFFIDEFQDINPIQLKILQQIVRKETLVCAVGDPAQSIYGFTGATADQFDLFTAPGMQCFVIEDNWRSTEKIVDLLNLVRTDLSQNAMRGVTGNLPVVVIGDKIAALQTVTAETGSTDICTLTRDNLTANAIRKGLSTATTVNLIHELSLADSNSARTRALIWCTRAVEYAGQGYFKDALKETSKINDIADELLSKKRGLEILKILLDDKDKFIQGSIMDLYQFITDSGIAVLSKPTGSAIKTFYDGNTYTDLSIAVHAVDESLPFRTIHKSKGDEFDAVLLVLAPDDQGNFNEATELAFLINPDLTKEEQRIQYVAISRAQNHLYINIPSMTNATKVILEARGLHVNP